ncbi:unnamed protein product [Aphanomyces euteiches]
MRNINHEQFMQCWGDSFTIAIASELKSFISGQEWLQATLENPALSVHDEVIWWLDNNLTTFVVQWQNYILPGLVQTVTVKNAFGVQYPLTLQSRNGKWRLIDQTSMKMYWSFARDLWACSSNASGIGGLSLVRSSSRFAFENISIQTVMIQNKTLPPVMSWGAQLFEQHVGSYGSIDVHYILPPGKLVTLISNLDKELKALCFTNASFSSVCKGLTVSNTYQTVIPSMWQNTDLFFFSGTPLCTEGRGQLSPYQYWDAVGSCTLPSTIESMLVFDWLAVVAVIASGTMTNATIQETCLHVYEIDACLATLGRALYNIQSFNLTSIAAQYQDDISTVRSLADTLNVSLFQFASTLNGSRFITLANVFSVTERGWGYWSWVHLYAWATLNCEVISLTGAHGTFTVLSTSVKPQTYTLKGLDIPESLCIYFRRGVQYVTFLMSTVVAMLIVYFVVARGNLEPHNVVKINSVGAAVWVGRPLLFLRAISALSFLSTGQIELVQSSTGIATKFQHPNLTLVSCLQIILVSGEVCWLAYIVQDILSVWTKGHTRKYSSPSSIMMWATMAITQLTSPVLVRVTLDPKCTTNDFDFDFSCNLGVVTTGSLTRLCFQLILIVACLGLCLGWVVYKQKKAVLPACLHASEPTLLYSMAAHLFKFEPWMLDERGVAYLDKASALLNGLVTYDTTESLYMLDVKTWRTFQLRKRRDIGPRLAACVPLAGEWE